MKKYDEFNEDSSLFIEEDVAVSKNIYAYFRGWKIGVILNLMFKEPMMMIKLAEKQTCKGQLSRRGLFQSAI